MQNKFIPAFGRHETFCPRYAWLKKAHDKVSADPLAFRREDATMSFGVGRNMVHAIKFWSLAFKITRETRDGIKVTDIGRRIFDDDGFDPYLERRETLWLLHWLLLSRPCRVPVWWIMFHDIASVRIEIKTLHDDVMKCVREKPELGNPSPRSVKRDVLVFLRMYAARQDKLTTEEYLDNPFMNIGLTMHDKDHVRFAYGRKPGITPELVAYACADFADQEGLGSSVSANTLVRGVGSVFKMDEGDLSDCLQEAERASAYSTQEINGTTHMAFAKPAKDAAAMLLESLAPMPKMQSGQTTAGRLTRGPNA